MTTPPPSIVDVYMPISDFRTPEGDIVNESFITESWLVDQWIGDQLWTWGYGLDGRLGNNLATYRSTPVTTFAGGTNWKQGSANVQCAAIKTDGTLWVWGFNDVGQLGINNLANRNTPVTTFSGGTNWKQVSCSFKVSMAIKTDGTLWTWGINTNGQLGINNTANRNTPVTTFAGGNNWKQISNNANHAAAIKTDGTLWTWGINTNGQLGINNTANRNTPVTTFAGGNNWKQVSCGEVITSAIKTDGTLWIWGGNNNGELGTNDNNKRDTPVTTFAGGNDWKHVNVSYHILALKSNNTLWTWGYNEYGQLGTNDSISRSTPVTTFAGGNNWKTIECSTWHSSAIKTDGTLWVWGDNYDGFLGTNDAIIRSTPVTTFAGGNNWKQVSCGPNNMLSITSGPDY
jgi:alpha-tubulin suppressor-like RCC1 family protein